MLVGWTIAGSAAYAGNARYILWNGGSKNHKEIAAEARRQGSSQATELEDFGGVSADLSPAMLQHLKKRYPHLRYEIDGEVRLIDPVDSRRAVCQLSYLSNIPLLQRG